MATKTAKSPTKTQRLQEIAALPSNITVDRANGIIPGVKVLGYESRNGRRYTESAVKGAIDLYEGARVNVNHRKPNSGDRPYEQRIGVLRNVRLKAQEGLFGDLHYNPKHALAEQLAWDAENAPGNVGLSHDAEGKTRASGNGLLVEEITRVHSVDLVSDPATVRGLYESETMDGEQVAPTEAPATPDPASAVADALVSQIVEIAKGEGDAKTKAKAIADLLKKQEKIVDMLSAEPKAEASADGESTPEEKPTPESKQPTVGELQEQVKKLQARDHVRKLLEEAKHPATETVVEALAALPTDELRKSLIESLAKPAEKPAPPAPKPRSSMFGGGESLKESTAQPTSDPKAFAARLRSY